MMKTARIIICSIIVASLFLSCGGDIKEGDRKGGKAVSVDVIIASESVIPASVQVNGTVLSGERVDLHTEASGKITYLNIPDGERVVEGTILARINDADLQAELEQLKVDLILAEKTEERYRQLLEAKGIDQATYDAALSNVDNLKARIKVKNAQIDKTVVKAPFTGRLGLRQVSIGAYVTATTVIGTLQSEDVKVDFAVPEGYASMLVIGNKILLQSGTSGKPLVAIITAIEPQINTLTGNIKVRARLETGKLNPGSFVKVTVDESRKGIIVPTHSVIPDAFSNLLIVVKNGKPVFTPVETGIRNASVIEIKNGITAGDTIVVNGVLFVRPGGQVRVDKILNLSDLME